jgi:nitroreductase
MTVSEAIFNRKSIRNYLDKELSDNDIQAILKAGMSGPSCVNANDWSFIVARNKNTLDAMSVANGKFAIPLKKAKAGILICGDLSLSYPLAKDYWIIDCAIAAQNIMLEAQELGIGSVMLGVWPEMDRVENQQKLFRLPRHIIPHSIIALGYMTDKDKTRLQTKEKYDEKKIHFEKW